MCVNFVLQVLVTYGLCNHSVRLCALPFSETLCNEATDKMQMCGYTDVQLFEVVKFRC